MGTGVVNWDYVALKVNSQTRAEMWRRTYGQPRGFEAQWIHDEMYGVALDKEGNYLLLGGSGDEYTYSADGSGEWQVENILSQFRPYSDLIALCLHSYRENHQMLSKSNI